MNIDLVRKIDFWAGIPGLLAFDTGESFYKASKQKTSSTAAKISFHRAFGDGQRHPGLSDHESP